MSIGTCMDTSSLQKGSSFSRPTERNDDPDVIFSVFETYARLGDVDKALEAAKEIPPGSLKVRVFCKISQELAEEGHIDEALQIVGAVPSGSFAEKDLALVAIGNASVKAGDVDRTIDVARKIFTMDNRKKLFSNISEELARTGSVDEATYVVE